MKVLYPVCTIFVLKIDIPMDILFLVGGLLLILLGANGLTDGAASVAKCGGKQYVQYPDDCGLYGPFCPDSHYP